MDRTHAYTKLHMAKGEQLQPMQLILTTTTSGRNIVEMRQTSYTPC